MEILYLLLQAMNGPAEVLGVPESGAVTDFAECSAKSAK